MAVEKEEQEQTDVSVDEIIEQAESSESPTTENPSTANTEMAAADAELDEAADQAEAAAQSEGVKINQDEPGSSGRTLTPEQTARRARQQRAIGERMLNNRRSGLAAIEVDVTINNYLVSAYFTRYFPVIESCLHTLKTQGEYRLGTKNYEALEEQLTSRINDFIETANNNLKAVQHLVSEIKPSAGFIQPTYSEPEFKGNVQLKTPMALDLLKAFIAHDQTIAGIETLYWNGERQHSDVNDAVQEQKREISPIFTFASRTLVQMRNAARRN